MPVVSLYVYDLSMGAAKAMSTALIGKQIDGIWHTGVEVFGQEYFFGGGIQVLPHSAVLAHFKLQPTEKVELGTTTKTRAQLQEFLSSIKSKYTHQTYDLFHNNCNNFSDEVCHFLLGKGIPAHITGLPAEVLATPLGQVIKPMVEGMQRSMAAESGCNDPFSAMAGGTPAAPTASAAAAGQHVVCQGDTCRIVRPPTAADGAHLLSTKLGEPLINAHVVRAEPFVRRLEAVSRTMAANPATAPAALSEEDVALLRGGAEALAAAPSAPDADCAVEAARWAAKDSAVDWPRWYALLSRVHLSPQWPSKAKVATLFLLRAAAARPCAAGFYTLLEGKVPNCPNAQAQAAEVALPFTDAQETLSKVLQTSLAAVPAPGTGTVSPCDWMIAGTALAFAGNLLGHAVSRPTMLRPDTMQPVVTTACNALLRGGPDGSEADCAAVSCGSKCGVTGDAVLLAAAGVLHNYALALFPGALVSDSYSDATTALLCQTFAAVEGQKSGRVATRLFSALAHLLTRQGAAAVELATMLELPEAFQQEAQRWLSAYDQAAAQGKKVSCHVSNAAALAAHVQELLSAPVPATEESTSAPL